MKTYTAALLLLALCIAPIPALVNGDDDNPPDLEQVVNTNLTGMIEYDNNLIVLVQDGTAVAIKFEETKPFTVTYTYRLLSKKKPNKEEKGSGELFDEPLSDKPASIWIKAGPFKQQWSYSAPGKGWLYYKPEGLRMYIVGVDKFDKLDLKRFTEL